MKIVPDFSLKTGKDRQSVYSSDSGISTGSSDSRGKIF